MSEWIEEGTARRRRWVQAALVTALSYTMLPALAQAPAQPGNASTAKPHVRLTTSAGDIVLELYPDKAPKTVENFLQYVRDKHYDGTVFHRVIDNFMVQGGGFVAK